MSLRISDRFLLAYEHHGPVAQGQLVRQIGIVLAVETRAVFGISETLSIPREMQVQSVAAPW